MYKNRKAKVTAGKTQPIMGTKIEDKYEVLAKTEGKKEAAIVMVPINHTTIQNELTANSARFLKFFHIFNTAHIGT